MPSLDPSKEASKLTQARGNVNCSLDLNPRGNESSRSTSILLVVQVCGGDGAAALADVVAGVADSQDLGAGDGAEGLTALWVTEDDDCMG